jgi:hydroxymethylbilane synthase
VDIGEALAPFEHRETSVAARAERALGLVVEGSCEVPLGGLATVRGEALMIEGFIGLPDGSRTVRMQAGGDAVQAEAVGSQLGARLLANGGRQILDELKRFA